MNNLPKKKNTLLWKIEGAKIAGTSYLFGTMHVKDLRAFQLMDLIYPKIDQCESFATEFNLEEMEYNLDPGLMNLPDGQVLEDFIENKTYKKLSKIFRKTVGIEIENFQKMQPLIIANMINERILSADMPVSLDMHLWDYAKSQEKITLGIETYQEQINILKKIPLEYQLKSLIDMGKNFKKHRKGLLKMTSQYQKAEIQKLYKSGLKSAKGLKKLLIFDRNLIMAERFYKHIKEQTMFYAVGAGHLGGEKGLLRLLKKRGLKVKPVQLSSN